MYHVPDYKLDPPEYPEPEIVAYCKKCDCELYDGDTAYKIGEDYYCEDCVEPITLEYVEYEPDWDSMPGGHDDY